MKKFLIIMLSLLLACSAVFAAEGTDDGASAATGGTGSVNSGAEDGSKQATTLVTLDLSGGENSTNYWEIGFTNADVTSAKSPETNLPSTTMILSENAMTAEDDGEVWVYWIIKGGQKVKISLAASGALAGSGSNAIDWNVTWKDKEGTQQTLGPENLLSESSDVGVYTTAKNVHTRTSSTGGDYGAVQLEFITEDFTAAAAGKYEATLTLTIEPNGTT